MKRVLIGLVILLFLHAALGQKIQVKYDKTADFSKYKTYSWVEGMPARNPLINQMITEAVDQQLATRGLRKAEANGDLQVMFAAAVDLDLQVPGVTWSNASAPQMTMASIGPPMNVRKGMLVVDLMDKKTERYLWRATSRQTLAVSRSGDMAKDAQRVEKLVKKTVAKMFNKYPATK